MKNLVNKPIFKIRASCISKIMADPKWWSPKEKYEKKLQELHTLRQDYESILNKDTKTAQNKWDKILKIEDDLNELEAEKDKIQLSKTCIKYLEDWIKEVYYWRPKVLDTKELQKWIECENEAVFVYNQAMWTDYKKSVYNNGDKMENEWMTGHEDVDVTDQKKTIDLKTSYCFDTFPILKEDIEEDYYRQWQWYLCLKWEDYMEHEVAKVLVNTPAWQLQTLLYNLYSMLSKKYADNVQYIDEEFTKQAKTIFLQHVFDKQLQIESNWETFQLTDEEVIPRKERIKIYKIDRNNEDIEKIKKRVEECRIWLSQNFNI